MNEENTKKCVAGTQILLSMQRSKDFVCSLLIWVCYLIDEILIIVILSVSLYFVRLRLFCSSHAKHKQYSI